MSTPTLAQKLELKVLTNFVVEGFLLIITAFLAVSYLPWEMRGLGKTTVFICGRISNSE